MTQNDYQICVRGHLDERWFRWFDGLTIALTPDGQTCIRGTALDHASLHALLNRIRDLGLDLISVQQLEAEEKNDQWSLVNRQLSIVNERS